MSNIILNLIGSRMPQTLLIFLSTTYAIIFFNLINYKTIALVYKKILNNKRDYFFLLFTLLGIWGGAFFIPIYFFPSVYLFTFMSIGSIIGASVLFYQQKAISNFLRAIFLFVNIVIFYAVCSRYYFGYQYIVLILSTIFTAVSGYFYMKISMTFNKHQFSASQILAIRFWLLWLLSLIGVLYYHQFVYLSFPIISQASIVSFLSLIIPVYCFQKAIEKLGSEKASLGIGFTPLITFLLEKIFLKNSFDFTGYFAIMLSVILTLFYLYRSTS